jgi:plastocyanin
MTARGAGTLLAAAALASGVAACGGGDTSTAATASSTTTSPTATAAAEKTEKVAISNYKFQPDVIEVSAGTKVTFTNSDDTTHTATADDGSFDTGDLDQGDSGSVTLSEPGEFTYYCRYHPFMKATVEVPN